MALTDSRSESVAIQKRLHPMRIVIQQQRTLMYDTNQHEKYRGCDKFYRNELRVVVISMRMGIMSEFVLCWF